ncbi:MULTISPECIES: glycoside hydrolase family 3 N-terminal domain-containing protein [Variovorax]|jgi:beta-N-acetylhexosaminidase|uniref:glycoside hydrolase family 3 N-terminal domain-containing protein n=1 Tax=Variovorax TaxID=34072 RepID=UPI00086C30F8|nr:MULTISPECIES: glycoside hydrolase family 3 N-terminal domain-containing protein [Variovorax]MBN8755267.1 glycoside hydrolase family 3 protein [Variovorax sp.]ODU15981.1 MAG: beta-hexosaminidase [Variovorax sp. SCN 67-85]ODV21260.1 MAG: beta-hexosaminidase [Variovorax sp. SCN 67-20]OJZ14179.1 MAG: beta-hexosaminidase [Variovorax sp. 67-131]UKI08421.1 glycoside hydrolase family 3 protein [Variovorax paradoxus]
MKALRVVAGALGWLALAALWFWAWHLKDPHLRFMREWELSLLLGVLTAGIAVAWRFARGRLRPVALGLAFAALLTALGNEAASRQHRAEVEAASGPVAQALGARFIVGYDDAAQLRDRVRKGLIGGIFVTGRNVKGRTAAELRDEIAGLQALRREAGLPPLVVATDQEGGAVSRLSPLVEPQPALATLLDADVSDEELAQRAHAYGARQGRALAALGITLNFSPVVDLRPGRAPGRWDFHTRIDERAISADPAVTAQVALAYELGLESAGVRGTLKHFPGLAGVTEDTHHFAAVLHTPAARLATHDWKPFQEVSKQSDAAIMLGHVILPELDAEHPVSFSRRIVRQVIRGEWGYQGLLVTDDLTMGAAYNRGLCDATVRALGAGVDLLLIAYDHDKYFDAMHCALQAAQRGAPDLLLPERDDARRLQSSR